MAQNPYQPPIQTAESGSKPQSLSLLRSLVPPVIALVITLVLWFVLIYIVVMGPASDNQSMMTIWSGTFFVSLILSTIFVNYFWRSERVSPLAFGVVFALFAIAFCLLEGDTSGGTDRAQAWIVYGTMMAAPVTAATVSYLMSPSRIEIHNQKRKCMESDLY